jgi:hypothetical protein
MTGVSLWRKRECVEDVMAADGEGNPVREEAYHRLMAEGAAIGRSGRVA